ncbi:MULTISPECIES: Wzz/FepE/Etk N-terminal domain-containing protein [Brevibacterium]|uniref:Capsular polysaccharide biosynthesis protein n=1 Tax=Brevibacterium antiquum CNRZ 918 TaxID=1255637 RepID=A0A2H1KZI8_9MICO|nr:MULTISPECIES: Wzz/FepE/Etk N-terminal domain-containing protein [Brevibacterium]SMY05195.1 Capsular polysaccharide biosynthesis protein [Brevibacterium antiquum CNRZ 918]HCG56536.1 hypothetical protein [Brevibacterium sp.]
MEEASLRRVLTILRVRWRLVAALALPIMVLCLVYAATLPPSYTATTVMSFAPAKDTESGPAFARMISPYELTATSHATIAKAEKDAGIPPGDLRGNVSVKLPTGDLELSLEVTTTSAEVSTAAARSIVNTVKETADEDQRVVIWNTSEAPVSHDSTPVRRAIILLPSVLLALFPGAFLALSREGYRPRVWIPDDLRSLGIPVLQQIPGRQVWRTRQTKRENSEIRTAMRLWLPLLWELSRPASTARKPNEIIVTNLDSSQTEATPIAAGLRTVAESSDFNDEKRSITIRSAQWGALHSPSNSPRPDAETLCLLVIRPGLPQDHLKLVVDLAQGQGVRVVGSVFVSR